MQPVHPSAGSQTAKPKQLPCSFVLEQGFERSAAELAHEQFLLKAKDGYMRPASGQRLLEQGGYLALGEAEEGAGHWRPIGRRTWLRRA